jgi:hypothetical protein
VTVFTKVPENSNRRLRVKNWMKLVFVSIFPEERPAGKNG